MNNFKDFGIKPETTNLTGDKIKMERILNRQIKVLDYRLKPSKYVGKGLCLYLQFELNQIKHVVFTGSAMLIEMIEKIDKKKFPFMTTIVKEDERFEFT